MYKRYEIIQKLLDSINGETYLEIGVETGTSFIPIKAKRKIAVEPRYLNDIRNHHFNGECSYFEGTSDEFFSKYAEKVFEKNKIDVVFIDGLHTHEQTLKDFENVLPYLSDKGFVVFHDCNPTSEGMAFPVDSYEKFIEEKLKRDWDSNEWCGDVWKTIVKLRSEGGFEIFVLDCDYGVGVARKKKSDKLNLDVKNFKELPYSYLEKNRVKLLNLKEAAYIDKITAPEGI